MSKSSKRRSLGLTAAVGLCLCGATAFAALEVEHDVIDLPGVTRHGNLDLGHLSPVPFKIVINTRTHRVVALGRGNVRNLSGKLQIFRNQATMNADLINYPGLELKRDLFVVLKNGKCRATAVATLAL